MKAVDDKLPYDLKVRAWMGRHFKHVFIASALLSVLSLLILLITVVRYTATVQAQANAIKNLTSRVIVVRADGKVAALETQELTQSYLSYVLRDLVLNYLPLSGFDFDAVGGEFQEVSKIPKVARMLAHFDRELGGVGGYRAYLEFLHSLYKANNLPEVVWVGSLSELSEDMRYQDRKFEYVARVPLNTFYAKYQRWNRGSGTLEVYLQGVVDLSKSTQENPMGVFFTKVEVKTYVGKGEE